MGAEMTKDEALKLGLQVIEAAEYLANNPAIFGEYVQEKRALKRALIQRSKISFEEALVQPEQEPVANGIIRTLISIDKDGIETWKHEPFYTTPPQREWVGLTDEDWDEIFGDAWTIGEAIKVTEAKLKEKNT